MQDEEICCPMYGSIRDEDGFPTVTKGKQRLVIGRLPLVGNIQ